MVRIAENRNQRAFVRVVTAEGNLTAERPFLGGVDLVPSIVIFAFLLLLFATLLASLLPIWKATRRPIAETLRGG